METVNDDCWFCGEPLKDGELYVDIQVNKAGVEKIELFHRGHLSCVLKKHDDLVDLETLETIYGKRVVNDLTGEQYDLLYFRRYEAELREIYETFVWNVVHGEETDKQHACLGDDVVKIWNGASEKLKGMVRQEAEIYVRNMLNGFDKIEGSL